MGGAIRNFDSVWVSRCSVCGGLASFAPPLGVGFAAAPPRKSAAWTARSTAEDIVSASVEMLNPTKFEVLLERLPSGGLPKGEVEGGSERRCSSGFVFEISWATNESRSRARDMVLCDGRPRSLDSVESGLQISTPRMYAPDTPARRVKVSRTVRHLPSNAKENSLDAVPFRMDHEWMWVKWFIS